MSRLCRLKTKTHGKDGQWAHDEIVKLRALCDQMGEVLDEAVTYCEGPQWSPSMASECYKALTAWREMKERK